MLLLGLVAVASQTVYASSSQDADKSVESMFTQEEEPADQNLIMDDDQSTDASSSTKEVLHPLECAQGCDFRWVKDSFCDDACNVKSCRYDGGDCKAEGSAIEEDEAALQKFTAVYERRALVMENEMRRNSTGNGTVTTTTIVQSIGFPSSFLSADAWTGDTKTTYEAAYGITLGLYSNGWLSGSTVNGVVTTRRIHARRLLQTGGTTTIQFTAVTTDTSLGNAASNTAQTTSSSDMATAFVAAVATASSQMGTTVPTPTASDLTVSAAVVTQTTSSDDDGLSGGIIALIVILCLCACGGIIAGVVMMSGGSSKPKQATGGSAVTGAVDDTDGYAVSVDVGAV
jgi:hypothetical protein